MPPITTTGSSVPLEQNAGCLQLCCQKHKLLWYGDCDFPFCMRDEGVRTIIYSGDYAIVPNTRTSCTVPEYPFYQVPVPGTWYLGVPGTGAPVCYLETRVPGTRYQGLLVELALGHLSIEQNSKPVLVDRVGN